jgi:hypothetical protein
MKTRLAAASLILLSFGLRASAHRLDEYLQATTISLEKIRVQAQIRLTPGVAVFPFVIATIDTNGDGIISAFEQRAYAERVLGDLSLAVDGDHLKLELISADFPEVDAMKEGIGQLRIDFSAEVRGDNPERKLIFENHHQSRIASYLVNCLVPEDPDVRVTAQNRNYEQSFYELQYIQDGVPSRPLSLAWWSGRRGLLGLLLMTVTVRLALLRRNRAASRAFSANELQLQRAVELARDAR